MKSLAFIIQRNLIQNIAFNKFIDASEINVSFKNLLLTHGEFKNNSIVFSLMNNTHSICDTLDVTVQIVFVKLFDKFRVNATICELDNAS